MKLLTDGKEAFPEILKHIAAAEKSIYINMFIWRADSIGIKMAEELLKAADKGVEIFISVDRYGFVLEKSEECTHSFFHEKPTFSELVKIKTLQFYYPTLAQKDPPKQKHVELKKRLLEHQKVTVSRDIFKADHSKYYIIDEKILILGGINIEDKENGCDISGRRYQDYMVMIEDHEEVKRFRLKLEKNINELSDISFTVNNKNVSPAKFEAEETLLNIINEAEKELLIIMAYFSPLPKFIKAIHGAWSKGVNIRIIIPEHANFQNDLNKKTVKKLMKLCQNEIELYFFKGMVHTKLVQNEKELTLGSTNITQKAFKQLAELNLTVKRSDSDFFKALDESIKKTVLESKRIDDYKEIKYNVPMTILESLFV